MQRVSNVIKRAIMRQVGLSMEENMDEESS